MTTSSNFTTAQSMFFSNPHRRDVTSDMPLSELDEFSLPALVATGTSEIVAYEAAEVAECLEEQFA